MGGGGCWGGGVCWGVGWGGGGAPRVELGGLPCWRVPRRSSTCSEESTWPERQLHMYAPLPPSSLYSWDQFIHPQLIEAKLYLICSIDISDGRLANPKLEIFTRTSLQEEKKLRTVIASSRFLLKLLAVFSLSTTVYPSRVKPCLIKGTFSTAPESVSLALHCRCLNSHVPFTI